MALSIRVSILKGKNHVELGKSGSMFDISISEPINDRATIIPLTEIGILSNLNINLSKDLFCL